MEPATWYHLRVTAHNNAGFAVAEYEFATLTGDGSKYRSVLLSCAVSAVSLIYQLLLHILSNLRKLVFGFDLKIIVIS